MNKNELEQLKHENDKLTQQLEETKRKVDRLLELVVELNNARTSGKEPKPSLGEAGSDHC